MSNAVYHSGPGISKSHLDVMARSPAHYWQAYINPERAPRVATPAMVVGTAIHAAILEPDLFDTSFVMLPEHIDRRTKDGKHEYAEFMLEVDVCGYTVLTAEQHAIACGCRDSVRKHTKARALLAKGKPEQTYYGVDPISGALLKCRFDWEHFGHHDLDVKSTEDASPEGFIRSVLKYNYHAQVAWYREVRSMALECASTIVPWYFLAIEKSPPYAIGIYEIDDDLARAGGVFARTQLDRILTCKRTGQWPAFEPATLTAPGWVRTRLGLDTPEMDFA